MSKPISRPRTGVIKKITTESPRKTARENFYAQTKRPTTQSALQLKSWRKTHFATGGDASRREVELLGEWLNSVLADNLEQTENPLDIVTNAQHWYSVAFNELVRQVAVACTERGRLFAVIWKRNQDLFSKTIELHRKEREYILSCHKERVQFLKTDLDFTQSRFKTINDAYEEEKERWEDNSKRDISKFEALQQKIDVQMKERAELQKQIAELKHELGIEDNAVKGEQEKKPCYNYKGNDIVNSLKISINKLNSNNIDLNELSAHLDDIDHFLKYLKTQPKNYRSHFEYLFQTIPNDYKPEIKSKQWFNAACSFIYAQYLAALSKNNPIDLQQISLPDFCMQSFIHIFGARRFAERILLNLLATAENLNGDPSSRSSFFLRFLGIDSPLPPDAFHYYLYIIRAIQKASPGPMYPEIEQGEEMVAGIPLNIANTISQKVLERLCSGRALKFYCERIDKIALGGSLRFGGRPIAEFDGYLEYLVTAYMEEVGRVEDSVMDLFKKLPTGEVRTLDEFRQIMIVNDTKLTTPKLCAMLRRNITRRSIFPMTADDIILILRNERRLAPLTLSREDFAGDVILEDLVPFIQLEVDAMKPMYDNTIVQLTKNNDEMQLKQLKAAHAKLDQTLQGHGTSKLFEMNVRDYFERLALIGGYY